MLAHITAGQSETLTATVTSTGGTPAGSVSFLDGTTVLGSAPLNASGMASFTTSSLPVGGNSLTASYAANGNFNASTSTAVTVSVTASSSLPAPWSTADIGAPAIAGSATASNGTFTITGSGTGIRSSSDQFCLVSQPTVAGNNSISARVVSQTGTDGWAKTDLMIRASSDPASAYVGISQTVGNGISFEYRTASGGIASYTEGGPVVSGPVYLKLVQSGSTVSGYYSTDGVTWTLLASTTISMPSTELIGIGVTSHNATLTNTATVDNLLLTSP